MNGKTLIQFAHLSEQIACFVRLFAGENYDLNCNSVCLPRCPIHLVRKSSELQSEGYLLKKNSAELIVYGALKLIVFSWQDFIHCVVIYNNPQPITGRAHGMTVLQNTWENIVFPSNLHLNVCYLPKILNFTTDMTSKWITSWLPNRKY